MIVDSHAHLEMREFDADLPEVIERARRAGVAQIVTVATTPEDIPRARSIAERHPCVKVAAGYHPHEAKRISPAHMERLASLAPGLVAIGETGLDYFRMHSPKEDQRRVLGWHLDLAVEAAKPVILHLRQDEGEFMRDYGHYLSRVRGVVHCFSGDLAMARKVIEAGWLISVPGTITFSRTHALREIVRGVPLASLMAETDAPYLAPVPHRGTRNEPAYVVEVVKTIGEARGEPVERVAEATTAAARGFFGF